MQQRNNALLDTVAPAKPPLRKFSATRRHSFLWGGHEQGGESLYHYLIEARDRDNAMQIIREELGLDFFERKDEQIDWSVHETPAWRHAWRNGKVVVLKETKLPSDIE